MRRTEQSIDRASALASIVLPTPGTSSIKTCPSASRAMRARRTTSGLPSMTRWILARILSKVAARSSIPPISGRVVATGRAPFHDSFLVFDSRRVCEDFRFAPPGNRETSWSGDLSAAPRSMWGELAPPTPPQERLCHGNRRTPTTGEARPLPAAHALPLWWRDQAPGAQHRTDAAAPAKAPGEPAASRPRQLPRLRGLAAGGLGGRVLRGHVERGQLAEGPRVLLELAAHPQRVGAGCLGAAPPDAGVAGPAGQLVVGLGDRVPRAPGRAPPGQHGPD